MPRLKTEKITGIVAVSYLVLIPVGGFLMWQKLQAIDEDLTAVWDQIGMDVAKAAPKLSLARMRKLFR